MTKYDKEEELFSDWHCARCKTTKKLNALAIQAFCENGHKMYRSKLDPAPKKR